jgi:glycosyltransferase involved in cell wall biosynthesis
MQVLSFTNCPLDPNLGSGKTVLSYTQGLRELGHTVDVATPKDYEPWMQLGGRVKKFRQAWGAWNFAQQKLQKQPYDLLEFYGDEFWLITKQLSKQPNRPLLVAHTNGLELLARDRSQAYKPQQNPLKRWFFQQTHARFSRIAFDRADAFVSLCELDCQYVLDRGLYPADRVSVVEPGLDEEYLSLPFIPQKQDRIAFMGSWIDRKGINNLITVMTRVLTQHPTFQFDIYGTGRSPASIHNDFPAILRDRIIVHPRSSNQDIANGLAQAKVFFFPSQYEGFGIALAEAMACSCAAVTTPTGFGAALKHEQEAIQCDFNDVDAMTNAILQLLANETWRAQIAHQGWQRVQSLRWDTNIQKLEILYSQWVAEHRQRENQS